MLIDSYKKHKTSVAPKIGRPRKLYNCAAYRSWVEPTCWWRHTGGDQLWIKYILSAVRTPVVLEYIHQICSWVVVCGAELSRCALRRQIVCNRSKALRREPKKSRKDIIRRAHTPESGQREIERGTDEEREREGVLVVVVVGGHVWFSREASMCHQQAATAVVSKQCGFSTAHPSDPPTFHPPTLVVASPTEHAQFVIFLVVCIFLLCCCCFFIIILLRLTRKCGIGHGAHSFGM